MSKQEEILSSIKGKLFSVAHEEISPDVCLDFMTVAESITGQLPRAYFFTRCRFEEVQNLTRIIIAHPVDEVAQKAQNIFFNYCNEAPFLLDSYFLRAFREGCGIISDPRLFQNETGATTDTTDVWKKRFHAFIQACFDKKPKTAFFSLTNLVTKDAPDTFLPIILEALKKTSLENEKDRKSIFSALIKKTFQTFRASSEVLPFIAACTENWPQTVTKLLPGIIEKTTFKNVSTSKEGDTRNILLTVMETAFESEKVEVQKIYDESVLGLIKNATKKRFEKTNQQTRIETVITLFESLLKKVEEQNPEGIDHATATRLRLEDMLNFVEDSKGLTSNDNKVWTPASHLYPACRTPDAILARATQRLKKNLTPLP